MPMQTRRRNANQGGRGNRCVLAEIVAQRQEEHTEKVVCDKLKARSYQRPHITELMKNTKASAAVVGMVAARPPAIGISPAAPVQASTLEANSRAQCLNYGKTRRAKNRTPNPF